VDKEDGVVALISYGLRVRVNEPGFLHRVRDDEHNFAVGDVGELEGLFDDFNVPAEELMAVDALFAMLARVLTRNVAYVAIAIGLLLRTGEGMERIGEDAAVLIDVAAQRGVDSVGSVVGLAGWGRGLG
jgi:hypothetical protein